jgi:cyclopropane-fatty-acyl-phospholipid synthase
MIDTLLEKDLLPDAALRFGIRRLLARRLRDEAVPSEETRLRKLEDFTRELHAMPIAINTRESRAQHYEVPTEFYRLVLGPRLKYSCCWYARGNESLAEAEEAMLQLYLQRARLIEGQEVLELGCGWGSLSLWLAERHPNSRITAVSHSRTQRDYIEARCRERGLHNLRVLTCDMNDFNIEEDRFDRIVSIEMFEHMKNWPALFGRISRWLRPEGLFFMHIFTHTRHAYHFEARDESDWMSRYFFTGGMMPDDQLVHRLQGALTLEKHWQVNGRHYQRTANHWLANMDAAREQLLPLFADTYGAGQERRWWAYWRIFFLSCSELWGYRGGEEWLVSHYLLRRT